MSRLIQKYKKNIQKELVSELALANIMEAPKLSKIIVNTGVGKILQSDPKRLDYLVDMVKKITGQHPLKNRAKKAISAFKIREGQVVGVSATLRGKKMYEFFDKLVNVALPRSRDFRGISKKGFDRNGNFSLGIREHGIFPEMMAEDISKSFGLEVVIVTSADTDEQGYILLKKLGFPFKD